MQDCVTTSPHPAAGSNTAIPIRGPVPGLDSSKAVTTHGLPFRVAGMGKYDGPTLFDVLGDDEVEDAGTISDAFKRLSDEMGRESLLVVYYSSFPDGVGSIYWAPAKLSGKNYLDFTDPESLTFVTEPSRRAAPSTGTSTTAKVFADGQRPRTSAKLRIPVKVPRQ